MEEKVKMLDSGFEERPLVILNIGETFCGENFYIERQSMQYNVIEYVVDGEGTIEIDGKTLHIQKNDFYMLKHSLAHKYYSDNTNPWKKIFITFYGPAADFLIDTFINKHDFVFHGTGFGETFISLLRLAFSDSSPDFIQTECSNAIFKMLNELQTSNETRQTDLADRIKQLIDFNLHNGFSLDDICMQLNYSKNHIVNTFSAKFKITPYKYYIKARTILAKKYLISTSLSVSTIADLLSYSDQAYFYYSFKKETGLSPTEYRLT